MPRRPLRAARTPRTPGATRATLTALALVATSTLGAGGALAATPQTAGGLVTAPPGGLATAAGDPVASDDVLGGLVDKVSPGLADADGTVTAFVQLDTPSGLDVAEDGGDAAAVQAATEQVEQVAEDVVPAEAAPDASARAAAVAPQRIATLSNLVSGTLVTGDAAQVRELAASDDVVAVYRVTSKTADNSSSDAFTRALQVWQDTGQTGEGVRIGVIDTGLDYTHADFGGPGTEEAYAAAYGEDGSQPVPDGLFDPAKYLGGYDFAGPLYDADPASELPGATTTPTPDENPIDSLYTSDNSGHGTHVAGTAAGYGVQADGTTFDGDYATLTDLSDWQVGPGSAPGAGLYALKVFGDIGGSTDLTGLALDWAADPDGDGDFGDHLDVVNLSLGASATPSDDPDNLLIDRLSDLGTLAVLSAGNSGDITDVGGSPGSAASGLTVANSVGSPQTYDGVEVTAAPSDPALVTTWAAQNSINYTGTDDVTAPVVYLGDEVDGCTPLDAYAAQLAGSIAYLWWDDDDATRACGSGARWNNAEAAGAVGVLIGTESTVFSAGIAGNATIPGAQLTASSTDALLPAIQAGGVVAHIGPSLAASVVSDEIGDALNPGSSRGAHGSLGIAKPDVAAPGTLIFSAASGTGNAAHSLSGTSMAAPHVAGIAALVRATQPGWTPAQVKAAVMNTATHDVWTGAQQSGTVYGPQRVGSGRVDARDAVADTVLAYASEDPDQVSVTFGVVDVGAELVSVKKTVTVQNTGTAPVTYGTAFEAATTTGGATITTSPASVTVPAGQQRLVTLTLTADPATLERELDPTSAAEQGGVPREYVAALSGRLVLTAGGSELRVPVQAAPRLVSELTADPLAFASAGATTAPFTLAGRGVDSGGWTSLVAPLNLGTTSPKLEDVPGFVTSESAIASGDIRWVGWTSTAPQQAAAGGDPADGYLGIGIAVDGDWATLGQAVLPIIDWDLDSDGTPDAQTYVQKLSDATDVTVAVTVDAAGDIVDIQPVNGYFGDVDTTVFDNSVLIAPVGIAALGLEPGATPSVTVWTASDYAADPTGQVDATEPFTIDPYDPPYWFDAGVTDALWYIGADATELTVHRSATTAAPVEQLLVLHSHNADPTTRAQVLDVTVPATPTSTVLKVTGTKKVGKDLTLTATVSPAQATGTVSFRDGTKEVATATVTSGKATAKVRLGGGAHSLKAVFTPNAPAYAGSTSAVVRVDVAKGTSTTALTLSRTSGTYGASLNGKVTVTGQGALPTGTVQIREGSTVLGTGKLVAGKGTVASVTIALPKTLKAGSHTLTAVFPGSADLTGSTAKTTYRVQAATPKIRVSTSSWTVSNGAKPQVTVTVTGTSGAPVPGGKVTVVAGLRPVATVALSGGKATVTLPAVRGTTLVTALYAGDGGYAPTLTSGVLRLR